MLLAAALCQCLSVQGGSSSLGSISLSVFKHAKWQQLFGSSSLSVLERARGRQLFGSSSLSMPERARWQPLFGGSPPFVSA